MDPTETVTEVEGPDGFNMMVRRNASGEFLGVDYFVLRSDYGKQLVEGLPSFGTADKKLIPARAPEYPPSVAGSAIRLLVLGGCAALLCALLRRR